MRFGLPTMMVASAVLLAGCDTTPASVAGPQEQASFSVAGGAARVTGHANFTFGGGFFQTTSFSAIELPSGEVSGAMELHVHGPERDYIRGRTTCVRVQGNEAVLSGPVTSSGLGSRYWFLRVRDNGEGSDAPRDQWSDVIYGFNATVDPSTLCNVDLSRYGYMDIEDGNIQVR